MASDDQESEAECSDDEVSPEAEAEYKHGDAAVDDHLYDSVCSAY